MNIEQNIITKMLSINATLSVAESVTGGRVSSIITAISGSSKVFTGGIVAYTNSLKTEILKIDRNAIKQYGEVSAEIAIKMAYAVRELCRTTYGLATTGYAGPTGKDIGRIYIACADSHHHQILNLKFDDKDRQEAQDSATQEALQLLNDFLINLQ